MITHPTMRLTDQRTRIPEPSQQATKVSLVAAGWAMDHSQAEAAAAIAAFQQTRLDVLNERIQAKNRMSVPELLTELSTEAGMSWSAMATVTDVSVSAIRKWRKGAAATPENWKRLAQLAAFLELLDENAVDDPARWMEVELPLPSGYNIRPLDIYLSGNLTAVLDIANGEVAGRVLDDIDPTWRERRSDYEVVDGPDGHRLIRPRARD